MAFVHDGKRRVTVDRYLLCCLLDYGLREFSLHKTDLVVIVDDTDYRNSLNAKSHG